MILLQNVYCIWTKVRDYHLRINYMSLLTYFINSFWLSIIIETYVGRLRAIFQGVIEVIL